MHVTSFTFMMCILFALVVYSCRSYVGEHYFSIYTNIFHIHVCVVYVFRSQSSVNLLHRVNATRHTSCTNQLDPFITAHTHWTKPMIRIPKIKPGKTATLSIASLQLIDTAQREVQVLIMNPTRELAVQVCTCTCVCMCVCTCVYKCVCSCVYSVQCRSCSFTLRAFCTVVCVYVCIQTYMLEV